MEGSPDGDGQMRLAGARAAYQHGIALIDDEETSGIRGDNFEGRFRTGFPAVRCL